MIYASLSEAGRYLGIHPRLNRALRLLTEENLRIIPAERTEIECAALYATRFDVQSSTDETRLFEYHRKYLDIFAVVAGRERVDIAAPASLTVTEQHDDYWGGTGTAEQGIVLTPGHFLVLFPGDAHRPGMAVTEPENVSRVVFKILYEDN